MNPDLGAIASSTAQALATLAAQELLGNENFPQLLQTDQAAAQQAIESAVLVAIAGFFNII